MKIFILRHEDRTQDATFFSPLTETGIKNSEKLIHDLEKIDINCIYSSPFVRTLQTVYPYSKKQRIPIKLEYSLSEIQHQDIIPKNSYQVRLPEYMADIFNADKEYNTTFNPEDHKYPEKTEDVEKRVKLFLKNLIQNNYKNPNKNILLVTHQEPCISILKIINHSRKDKKPVPDKLLEEYPKGKLSQVFEGNNWCFKPINYKI